VFDLSRSPLGAVLQLSSCRYPQPLDKLRTAAGQSFIRILPQDIDALRLIPFGQPTGPVFYRGELENKGPLPFYPIISSPGHAMGNAGKYCSG